MVVLASLLIPAIRRSRHWVERPPTHTDYLGTWPVYRQPAPRWFSLPRPRVLTSVSHSKGGYFDPIPSR